MARIAPVSAYVLTQCNVRANRTLIVTWTSIKTPKHVKTGTLAPKTASESNVSLPKWVMEKLQKMGGIVSVTEAENEKRVTLVYDKAGFATNGLRFLESVAGCSPSLLSAPSIKSHRLIIRNLSFKTSEEALRTQF